MADAGEGPAIRVGDAERRAVDERLQRAHGEGRLTLAEYEERAASAWAAVTRADLDALTRDLPAGGPPAAVPVERSPAPVGRKTGVPERLRRAGGLLGALVVGAGLLVAGVQLSGREDGLSVFSSQTIAVSPGDDRVEVGYLFGGVDVVVPDDARVVLRGVRVLGGVDCEQACRNPGPREITVDASGAFGSVDVLTQSEAAQADRDDRDDRDDDD